MKLVAGWLAIRTLPSAGQLVMDLGYAQHVRLRDQYGHPTRLRYHTPVVKYS